MTFRGKRVLVTGAASGIGAATARLLVERGARVVAVDVSGERLAELAANAGPAVIPYVADLTEQSAAEAMIAFAVAQLGGLDILINNAGVGALAKTADLDPVIWRRVMAVDVDAVFYACRIALPHLVESKGCIVNTASISGLAADYGFAAYNAAKAAVIGLTRTMAIDYARDGVRVNAISPGYTATNLIALNPQKVADEFIRRIPMGRAAEPEEMAKAIAFLASDDASFITGHNLVVDGGAMAHTGQPDIIGLLTGTAG